MMKTKPLLSAILCFTVFVVIYGCSPSGNLSRQNIAGFYKPDNLTKEVDYALFNISDSLTQLYFSFPLEHLKYRKNAGSGFFYHYSLRYEVYDGYEKGVLIDSGSVRGVDSLRMSGLFEDSLRLRAHTGKNYVIQLVFTDHNASKTGSRYLELAKEQRNSHGDFLLTDLNNRPLMRTHLLRNEMVRIRARFPQDAAFRLKQHGFSEPGVARAPFAFSSAFSFLIAADTAIHMLKFKGNVSEPFRLEEEGLYLDAATNGKRVSFARYYDGFPEIGSVVKMRDALRFIATDDEFAIMESLPARKAVDDFWIGLSGNQERALNQIRRYYGRVEEANRLFSILAEGWKSDRGMIYIVFGQPTQVYRNSIVEEWTYGDPGNPYSVRFFFHRNTFSGGVEDYILSRSDDYRRPWHLAVSNWRR